jgi:hypothetical protein
MNLLYRAQIEAERKEGTRVLRFSFAVDVLPTSPSNWIGNLYVYASSKEEADLKIRQFLSAGCDSWQYDAEPHAIDGIDGWGLDFMAAEERGDLHRLDHGEVIQGWGL